MFTTASGTHVGSLPHQLGGINLGSGSDNLGFTNPLLSGSTRKRLLQFDGEIDVLEKDRFDGDTPLLGGSFDLNKK